MINLRLRTRFKFIQGELFHVILLENNQDKFHLNAFEVIHIQDSCQKPASL